MMPCFDALYAPVPAHACSPATLDMFRIMPPPCAASVESRRKSAQKRSTQVDADDPVEGLGTCLREHATASDTGVIHEDIESSELLDGIRYQTVYLRFVRDISGNDKRLAALALI